MLKIKRPPKPEGFDEESRKNLIELEKQKGNKKKLKFNQNFWGKYKDKFFEVQHKKCGYCELFITDYGDVEHYRPKSIIEEIKTEGHERMNLTTVEGRTFKQVCETGYWWLAYDWDNYLLSCKLCNQPWKRALFPIKEKRLENEQKESTFPYCSPKKGDKETPLLLNPYDENVKPVEHLSFTKSGIIKTKNNSEFGIETIRCYGLHRQQATSARKNVASITYKLIKRFLLAKKDTQTAYFAAKDILDQGKESSICAGMVRIIFETEVKDYSWNDLKKFVKKNKHKFGDE